VVSPQEVSKLHRCNLLCYCMRMQRLHPKHETKVVTLRMPENQYAQLEREAKRLGVSVSELVRKRLASAA